MISLYYWQKQEPPTVGRAHTSFHVTLNASGSLFKVIFDPLSVCYAKLQTDQVE